MIELEDVSYSYPQTGKSAVEHLSLSLKPGTCVLVTGPSGAGKTTLCFAASGILDHEYGGKISGRIRIGGKDVWEYRDLAEISAQVGMVFDDPDAQLIFTTVEEEILSALERKDLSGDEIESRLSQVMDLTRLTPLKDRAPHNLSGGQKQRVVLAATLALGNDILILDEPTSELDEHGTSSIVEILKDLKSRGKTIVLVEHKFSRMRELADLLVIMEEGRISYSGPPDAALANDHLRSILIPDFEGVRKEPAGEPIRSGLPGAATLASGEQPAGITPPEAAPEETAPVISVHGLHHFYGEIPALLGVDLDIYPGEFLAIVGENGSGKTTLIKHFVGLLRPGSGTVVVDGHNAASVPIATLAHSVGLVFQNPDHMFFANSVREEVAFGAKNLGIPDSDGAVTLALKEARLEETGELYPRWLSRGERQRLAIACVRAMQTPVIVLDEPTTGLDGNEAREVMEILHQLKREGRTVIIVTHSREIATRCADRVITMDHGRIVSDTARGECRP
jgi:energy-coupling factor transporter ATP-binding protein EcfA2